MGSIWSRHSSEILFPESLSNFNCDDLVEVTQFTSLEIKFLYHLYYLHFDVFKPYWKKYFHDALEEDERLLQVLASIRNDAKTVDHVPKLIRLISDTQCEGENWNVMLFRYLSVSKIERSLQSSKIKSYDVHGTHDTHDTLVTHESQKDTFEGCVTIEMEEMSVLYKDRLIQFYEIVLDKSSIKKFKAELDVIFEKDGYLPEHVWQVASQKQSFPRLHHLCNYLNNIFQPLVLFIQEFFNRQEHRGEVSGTIQVEEGFLFNKWIDYECELKGGVLSQYHIHSRNLKQYLQLFGCFVEPIQVERLNSLSSTRKFIICITRPNKTRILLAITRDVAFEWYLTILMYTLESQYNRYDAFFPVRYNINAVWYVNGKPWFERLADTLEGAKKEIFLTNWWTSPEIYLRRGIPPSLSDRFDMILRKKAEEGVRIYMILWNETKFAQEGLMNRYAAKIFSAVHKNFKVMMHPAKEPVVWAHHQKTLVIDQKIAFQGGVDVCWGRWDDHHHRIADPCHTFMVWPGKDYFNPLIQGVEDTYNPHIEIIDRTQYPRMPWHDIHMECDGLAARDISRNFVERWNNSRQHLLDAEVNLSEKLIIMKQYPILTLSMQKRERINFNWYQDMPELPSTIIEEFHNKRLTRTSTNSSKYDNHQLYLQTCKVQILRSMSFWSGADHTEISIYRAYMDIIQKSKHYILIENQYFCTNTAGNGVQNMIGDAIIQRIRWAILENQKFRLYIIIPLTPDGPVKHSATVRCILSYAFESLFRGPNSIIKTLQREFPHVDLDEYITINSLRTHDFIVDRPITEQIYVHGKTIIVDDKFAIIASANLNDRSFIGTRDSELGAIVEDTAKVEIKMNGKPYQASRFAYTFRMFLFREFLGLDMHDNSVMDPISDETFSFWRRTSQQNTKIYEKVFPNAPSNHILNWDQLKEKIYESEISEKNLIPLLNNVQGFLIDTPRNFLQDGSLNPHLLDYEQRVLNAYIFQ